MKPARGKLGILVAPLVVVLGAALSLVAPPVQAQDSWIDDIYSYTSVTLVGGDYVWGAAIWQPAPVPTSVTYDEGGNPVYEPEGAQPLAVEFTWGDGTSTQFTSDTPSDLSWVWCDGSGYNCRVEAGHTYTRQGVHEIRVLISQGGSNSWSPVREDLAIDLGVGGSLTAKGTVTGRSAGMYDQQFPESPADAIASFDVTAKRKAGTTATTASVKVSVPGMHPDYCPIVGATCTGMTFTGKAAMVPLYVLKTKTGAEVILSRVEGRVTNTASTGVTVDAGGGWAQVHVLVQKGATTQVRIQIWNTSAGYTYLDTGDQPSFYGLDATNNLLSGSVKIS
jgi:hypothetical protein